MGKNADVFIKYLVIGYALLLGMIFILISVFVSYDKELSKSFLSYTKNTSYLASASILVDSSSNRSILLMKMINSDDAFEIDELNIEMQKQGKKFNENLIILEQLSDSADAKSLNQAKDFMLENGRHQSEIYALILDEKKAKAREKLLQVAFPLQDNGHVIMYQLKEKYKARALVSIEQHQNLLDKMKLLIMIASFPVMIVLFIVAFFSIKRLKKHALEQTSLLAKLENEVQERTQDLLLDKKLMHNLSEAIAIFDSQGGKVISNRKFDDILLKDKMNAKLPFLNLLKELFEGVNIEKINKKLLNNEHWSSELKLRNENKYMIINVALIDREGLSKHYFSVVLVDVSDLKITQNKLEKTSNYDEVTQLPNRRNYKVFVENLLASNEPFHLLFLDLDNFKWVNDHYGHDAGDKFLFDFGQAVLKRLDENNRLFRIGGDEFIVVMVEMVSNERLVKLAKEILTCAANADVEGSNKHEIGCSIGISSYPFDTDRAGELLSYADYAMYHAKKTGKNRYCIFNEEMKNEIAYLHKIEFDLTKAVKNKEFEAYYQPQYDIQNLKLVGAEALLRWPKNEEGKIVFISPVEFIPLAEKFGLINELGFFVFQQATMQIKEWQALQNNLPKIAINVSPLQISSGGFDVFIMNQLDKHDVSAELIDIEITESVLMDNLEQGQSSANCLTKIQAQGFEISIDDFGTGYSSLAYIKHLQVDRIKIDKSFIDDIETDQDAKLIVKAIIDMGHSLDLKVLAEGIETPNQLDILKALGCDEGQGYLFNKPLAAEEFKEKCLS